MSVESQTVLVFNELYCMILVPVEKSLYHPVSSRWPTRTSGVLLTFNFEKLKLSMTILNALKFWTSEIINDFIVPLDSVCSWRPWECCCCLRVTVPTRVVCGALASVLPRRASHGCESTVSLETLLFSHLSTNRPDLEDPLVLYLRQQGGGLSRDSGLIGSSRG